MIIIQKYKNYIEKRSKLVLLILLGLNFIIRLLIYFNTNLIYFSDYKSYLKGIEIINDHGTISLINGNFLFFNSYIGYFFKYILGSLDYYFIFNCLLGTLTSYIVYLICLKLTKNKLVGLLSVFLHTIYLEFMVFSSIFYTPIIMMFLLSLIILLLIHYFNASRYRKVLIIIALLFLINISFYFKGELKYLWVLLLIIGLINFRDKKTLIGFLLLGVLLTFSTRILGYYHILPYKKGHVGNNNFVFFGHTDYGGDGGDGAFIYKENEERYNKAFFEYCKKHNINAPSRIDKNNFQSEEVRKFIKNHPFKWINLQFYKFFRFFGVVPESNSYKVLVTGILQGHKKITAIALVLPFSLMVLLFVITINPDLLKERLARPELLFMGFLLLYYIVASVFYGQYQERYRMPVLVCFLIPLLSWSLIKFNLKELMDNKMILFFKAGVIILILGIWFSQIYQTLVVNKERYLRTLKMIQYRSGVDNSFFKNTKQIKNLLISNGIKKIKGGMT